MQDDDSQAPGTDATALGIVHCLRMLAEEAQSLCLNRTLAALRAAMEVCQAESIGTEAGRAHAFTRSLTELDDGGVPLSHVVH